MGAQVRSEGKEGVGEKKVYYSSQHFQHPIWSRAEIHVITHAFNDQVTTKNSGELSRTR
jgi:hypothetical protein